MTQTIIRLKKSETSVPSSLAEASMLLGELGKTQDSINDIEQKLKDDIERLKAEALQKLGPLVTERDNKVNSLFSFAHPRKAELTEKVKTIMLSTGSFGWRLTPPSVEMTKSDEDMIAFLKQIGKKEFVRVIEEIDRKALLAEKPIIKGISYIQTDEFFVLPNQAIKKPKIITHAIDR